MACQRSGRCSVEQVPSSLDSGSAATRSKRFVAVDTGWAGDTGSSCSAGFVEREKREIGNVRIARGFWGQHVLSVTVAATSRSARGFLAAINNSVRAAPEGARRPCSHSCSVRNETPGSSAKRGCESPRAFADGRDRWHRGDGHAHRGCTASIGHTSETDMPSLAAGGGDTFLASLAVAEAKDIRRAQKCWRLPRREVTWHDAAETGTKG